MGSPFSLAYLFLHFLLQFVAFVVVSLSLRLSDVDLCSDFRPSKSWNRSNSLIRIWKPPWTVGGGSCFPTFSGVTAIKLLFCNCLSESYLYLFANFDLFFHFNSIWISLSFMKLLCSNTKHLKLSNMNNNDVEYSVPISLCAQASRAAQFSLLVRPANPRRQNLRALARVFPRLWGMDDIVSGRVVEHNRAQFLFPSNEAMNLVIRRGPWSFNQWMVAMDPWHLNVSDEKPNMINFWVQIKDIPLQYLSVQMVNFIAETLGIVSVHATEASLGNNNEFGRVCIRWPLSQPLVFQRIFKFGLDSATVTFHYERLRNHCFRCKSLQHDESECDLPVEEAVHGHQDPESDDDLLEDVDITNTNGRIQLALTAPPNPPTGPMPRLMTQNFQRERDVSDMIIRFDGRQVRVSDVRGFFHQFTAIADPTEAEARRRRILLDLEHLDEEIIHEITRPLGSHSGYPTKRRRLAFSMGSSSNVDLNGGAAGPIPPPVP